MESNQNTRARAKKQREGKKEIKTNGTTNEEQKPLARDTPAASQIITGPVPKPSFPLPSLFLVIKASLITHPGIPSIPSLPHLPSTLTFQIFMCITTHMPHI